MEVSAVLSGVMLILAVFGAVVTAACQRRIDTEFPVLRARLGGLRSQWRAGPKLFGLLRSGELAAHGDDRLVRCVLLANACGLVALGLLAVLVIGEVVR